MRTLLFFIMIKPFAIFAQARHKKGNIRYLDESKALTPSSDSKSNDSNTTACEAPPMIEAVGEDEMLLLARDVGWHYPCFRYYCRNYCTWCGSYKSKSGKHKHCDYYFYSWAC